MDGRLIVTEAGRDRVHELCDDLTVVGRSLDADLILKDQTVAPTHCEIRRSPEGFKVIDLETLTGTIVNGKPVNQHYLKHGDTVELGGARLTFLGDSAAPQKRARNAPPEPLRELPTGEDGQPRRFYRHEKEERLPPVARGAIAVAVICVLVLLVSMLMRRDPRSESLASFRRARALLERGDGDSVKEALKLLKALPRGEVDERLVEEEILRAETAIFEIEKARREEDAAIELSRLLPMMESATPDLPLIRTEIGIFAERFPDDARLPDLRKRFEKLGGGPVDSGARFAESQQAISKFLQVNEWKKAFESLKTMESDALFLARYQDRIGVLRGTVESKFSTYFERQQERALSAHGAGRSAEAIAIFQEFLDIGQEPMASTARRLLDRIR